MLFWHAFGVFVLIELLMPLQSSERSGNNNNSMVEFEGPILKARELETKYFIA